MSYDKVVMDGLGIDMNLFLFLVIDIIVEEVLSD